jgi:hypothetical protein
MKKLLSCLLILSSINLWSQCSAYVTPATDIIYCNSYPTSSFTAVATTTAGSVRHDWYSPYNPTVPFYTSTSFTCTHLCPYAPGVYTVVTTYTSIPCSKTSTFQVSSVSGFPTFNVSSGSSYSIGCLPASQNSLCIINAASASSASVQFLHIPPGSTLSVPASSLNFSWINCVSPSTAGTWTLVVLDPTNGCQSAVPVIISQYANPNINVAVSFPTQTLSCNDPSIVAVGSSGTPSAQIAWKAPSVPSTISSPTVNVGPASGPGFSNTLTTYGNYTVIATNPVNSCQTQSIVPFYQNFSGAGTSSFSYTVGANGVTTFSNTTSGTNPSCIWDFGDGYITIGNSVSHTYSVAGLYPVKLDVYDSGASCFKTSVSNVNVSSVPCTANTNFTVVPTNTPHNWNVTPAYPWNISNAIWNWGDGTTSNNLYSSHTYSAMGAYTLCLTATVSCGSSSSTCNAYYLYKGNSSAAMIQVNVVPPNSIATLVKNGENGLANYSIYPNPTNGELNVKAELLTNVKTSIHVYDLIGTEVYSGSFETSAGETIHTLHLKHLSDGVYFIKLGSGVNTHLHKLIINK